jgi:hypothetical protein
MDHQTVSSHNKHMVEHPTLQQLAGIHSWNLIPNRIMPTQQTNEIHTPHQISISQNAIKTT